MQIRDIIIILLALVVFGLAIADLMGGHFSSSTGTDRAARGKALRARRLAGRSSLPRSEFEEIAEGLEARAAELEHRAADLFGRREHRNGQNEC